MSSTKQQLITENAELRAELARSYAEHKLLADLAETLQADKLAMQCQIAGLHKKMHELNSARAKWEARARVQQSSADTGSSFAERAARARAIAMSEGRTVRL